jgi:hypothetical protein
MYDSTIFVDFAEHVALDRVAGMVSGIAACGNVDRVAGQRRFSVHVFRLSKWNALTSQLAKCERNGFLHWRLTAEPGGHPGRVVGMQAILARTRAAC